MNRAHRSGVGALVLLWAIACFGGLALLWRYKARPGDTGAPPAQWPGASTIARDADEPTLVMFAHPRCPCTRASLTELAEIARQVGRDASIRVVFSVPDGVGEDPAEWASGELWTQASGIPGVALSVDPDGALAETFRVETSGHVLVYDASGSLTFSGGITGARGHVGDNLGRARVVALLASGISDHDRSHVFGCAITGNELEQEKR